MAAKTATIEKSRSLHGHARKEDFHHNMKLNKRRTSIFRPLIVILLTIAVSSCASSSGQPDPTPHVISTPVQDEYTQAFTEYIAQLQNDGLVTAKEIRVEGSQPFISLLNPQNSQEVTDEDTQDVTDLVLHTVSLFESRGGLRHDDINIAFHRPAEQKIVLIKRRDMPELLSADRYGEVTVSIDQSYLTSLINLAGPLKNDRQDFADAWAVIQALCLGYSGNLAENDPICNIISANAAAGWVGMDQEKAEEIINSYGTTQLRYLGSNDYRYRFIPFVYEGFVRKNRS